MANRSIYPGLICARFEVCAHLLGWDITSPGWNKEPTHIWSTPNRFGLRKHGRADRWEVFAFTNTTGGETMIKEPVNGREMLAWLDGILEAGKYLAPGKLGDAWRKRNGRQEANG